MRAMLSRLRPSGLRWRLAAWFTLVTLMSTAIVFVTVYRGTGTQVRHQIDQEIGGDARELAHNLALADARTPRQLSQAATRYIRSQPFSVNSTLLFALVPGAATSTNRPELFSRSRPDDDETVAEQARENRLSARLLTAPTGLSTLALPDMGELRLTRLAVHLRNGLSATVGVGEPLATVAHAQRGVARAFVLAASLALAVSLLAAYLIGSRVSRPLRRMAKVAAQVDAGDLHHRIRQSGETPTRSRCSRNPSIACSIG